VNVEQGARGVEAGLIIVNKPAGSTSRDCVSQLQRAARRTKFGHAGTLDPLATGVLLVAAGAATRLVEYLHDLPKSYVAEFEFGKSSPTLDKDGEVTLHPEAPEPTRAQLLAELDKWIGDVAQRPPQFSAIKVQGKRAYDLARRGEQFELAARPVHIESLELLHYDYPRWKLAIRCGSGTYVRSLGADVAAGLQTTAIMTSLVRDAIGPFTLDAAIALEHLQTAEQISQALRSPVQALVGWQQVVLDADQRQWIGNGRVLPAAVLNLTAAESVTSAGGRRPRAAALTPEGRLVALLELADAGDHWRPIRVFHETMATSHPNSNNTRQSPES
jgi:tRNA pseudouridine55 synthase